MVVQIEVREIALAVAQHDENLIVIVELAQQSSVLVVVQTVHVRIVPHFAPSEGGVAVTLQSDAMDGELCQEISFRCAPLDGNLREILVDEDFPEFRIRFERHLDDLRLAVGVGCEVHHLRSRCALRQIVLLITGDAGHVESLDEAISFLAITVDRIISGTGIVLLEDIEIEHVFAYEHLLSHTDNLVFAVFVEDDDVVEVRAVAHKLVLLQACADEAVRPIDIEFLVRFGHLRGFDGVEVADLRHSGVLLAVLVLKELEPTGRHFDEVRQVAIDLIYLCFQASHQFVGLVLIELQDALHLDFQQFEYVVLRHLTDHLGVVGRQALVDMLADGIDRWSLFEFLVFIDALLDEDLLQRLEMQLLQEFTLADLEFLTDQVLRTVCRVTQHIADSQELRLIVLDHAAVGRDTDLTIGEGIEGVDGLV